MTVDPFLQARVLDPQTSHIAMASVRPGKIVDCGHAVHEMLTCDGHRRRTDHPKTSGPHLDGLTDWEMCEMWVDISNPALAYLDKWRAQQPDAGGNNIAGFIRMGRKWAYDNGYVIDTGWVRRNKYLSVTHGRRQAQTGRVWNVPTTPVDPPITDKPPSRRDLEDSLLCREEDIRVLQAELAALRGQP